MHLHKVEYACYLHDVKIHSLCQMVSNNYYGKRQVTLKSGPFAIHRFLLFLPMFAIQCLPRRSPFAAPFAAHRAVRRVNRHSPGRFLLLFSNVHYSRFTAPFTVRHSPSHSPFAATFAVAFQCPLTLSLMC